MVPHDPAALGKLTVSFWAEWPPLHRMGVIDTSGLSFPTRRSSLRSLKTTFRFATVSALPCLLDEERFFSAYPIPPQARRIRIPFVVIR